MNERMEHVLPILTTTVITHFSSGFFFHIALSSTEFIWFIIILTDSCLFTQTKAENLHLFKCRRAHILTHLIWISVHQPSTPFILYYFVCQWLKWQWKFQTKLITNTIQSQYLSFWTNPVIVFTNLMTQNFNDGKTITHQ